LWIGGELIEDFGESIIGMAGIILFGNARIGVAEEC
jgi:hypothetical protein